MSTTQTAAKTGGVLAATCLSTLVVNANTSVVMGRHRPAQGTLHDAAASAAAVNHTLPTIATPEFDPAAAVATASWRD